VHPGQHGILRDVVVVPACDFVEPLQILVVGHELVDPPHGLFRVHVVRKGVFLNFDEVLEDGEEAVYVFAVEMEHHLLSILCFDVDCVVGGIEAFLIYLFDVVEGDVVVVEGLVFECLCTHMIEISALVGGMKDDKALLLYADASLHHSQNINEDALALKLFYLYLLGFLFGDL
jgi:hypothetical protein